jgi:hypothetical protein
MTRHDIPNGWYCDALPSGAWVVSLKGGGLDTDHGPIPRCPGGNLLWVRIAPDGVRFAGIGNDDDRCWLWDGTRWLNNGPAFGPRAVIWQGDVLAVVRQAGTPTGAIGWRYVADDGSLVMSKDTYADEARHIWEYTTRGDLVIGQAATGEGCEALVAGRRVLLAAGDAYAVNFNRHGDACSVACYLPDRSVLLWFTRADLDRLPTWTIPVAPPPPPPSNPPPEPPMAVNPPDVRAFVLSRLGQLGLRKADGGNNDATRAVSLNALNIVANDLNTQGKGEGGTFGLLEKTAGNRYNNRSIDTLTWKAPGNGGIYEVDVISDGEGFDKGPVPSFGAWIVSPTGKWVAPFPVATEPPPSEPPPSEPPPEPEPGILADILARLVRIEAKLDAPPPATTCPPYAVTVSSKYLGTFSGQAVPKP